MWWKTDELIQGEIDELKNSLVVHARLDFGEDENTCAIAYIHLPARLVVGDRIDVSSFFAGKCEGLVHEVISIKWIEERGGFINGPVLVAQIREV